MDLINKTNNISADITLLIFTLSIIGIMVGLFLAKIVLNRKNWKPLLVLTMTVGIVAVLVVMVISAGPLGKSKIQTLKYMAIGAGIVVILCIVIYLLANTFNSIDCYVAVLDVLGYTSFVNIH